MEAENDKVEEVSVDGHVYSARLQTDPDGGYVAEVPALPGCITQGGSLTETLENVRDAIACWLEAREDLARRGVHLP